MPSLRFILRRLVATAGALSALALAAAPLAPAPVDCFTVDVDLRPPAAAPPR
jgi:hypothetical protein